MSTDPRVPPPVVAGAKVGVAALSGPVASEDLEAGLAALEALGFEPVLAANLSRSEGLFAGSDRERVAAFHEVVADGRIDAVFFARGGHGILRILPLLDWELLARRDLAYVGYSDLTPLLNCLVSRLGLATLHGPMVATDLARGLEPQERDSLGAALRGAPISCDRLAGWGRPAAGRLLGGCLTLLAATAGTDWALRGDGAILFWEDVNEPLYRVDRMLTQLHLSGSLTGLEAMVIGRFTASDEAESELVPGLMEEWSRRLQVPVLYGLTSGHCRPNLTLQLGRSVEVDPRAGTLTYLPIGGEAGG